MKRDLPGTKPSRLAGLHPRHFLPAEFKPKLPDILSRMQFTPGTISGDQSFSTEPMRVTGVTTSGHLPGASVNVSASLDGVTIVNQTVTADSHGNAYAPAHQLYVAPAGSIIGASDKAIIDVEYFTPLPIAEDIKPHGRARIIPSMRRFVEEANASIGGVTTTPHQGMGRAPLRITVDPTTGYPITGTEPGRGPSVGKGSHGPKYPGRKPPGGGGPRPPRGR